MSAAQPGPRAAVRKIAHVHVKPTGWATVNFEDGCSAAAPPDADFEAPLEVGEEHLLVVKEVTPTSTGRMFEQIVSWGSPLEGEGLAQAVNDVFGKAGTGTGTGTGTATVTGRKAHMDSKDRSIMAQVALKEAQSRHASLSVQAAAFSKPKAGEFAPMSSDEAVVLTAKMFFEFMVSCVEGK